MSPYKKYRFFYKNEFLVLSLLLMLNVCGILFTKDIYFQLIYFVTLGLLYFYCALSVTAVNPKKYVCLNCLPISHGIVQQSIVWHIDWMFVFQIIGFVLALVVSILFRLDNISLLIAKVFFQFAIFLCYFVFLYLILAMNQYGSYFSIDKEAYPLFGFLAVITLVLGFALQKWYIILYPVIQESIIVTFLITLWILRRIVLQKLCNR